MTHQYKKIYKNTLQMGNINSSITHDKQTTHLECFLFAISSI